MSAEHPTPWHIVGQTIRDAQGYVVVSALNPCGMETRRQIVAAVNSASLAGGAMEKPQTESPNAGASGTGEYVPRAAGVETVGRPNAVSHGVSLSGCSTARHGACRVSGGGKPGGCANSPIAIDLGSGASRSGESRCDRGPARDATDTFHDGVEA